MSYYLDLAAELAVRGEYRAADAIRELYDIKMELETTVVRISAARDLLLRKQGGLDETVPRM